MATIGNTVATLADWAKRLDPDGSVPAVVELLSQSNEILDDMLWLEGNLPTGHRTTQRLGLPTVGFRQLNAGVTPSKSITAQVDDQCAMLEAVSEIDVDLVKLNGNQAAYRLSEASAFVEAMSQEMASSLFYANTGLAAEEFTGLAPRYRATTDANGQNIIKAGGSDTDNTSIWLVVWGPNTLHGIFPKASKAGILHEDLGEQLIQTGTGIGTGRMKAFVDRWQWKCGLSVRDWRFAVRICNIDISNLVDESSAADLIKVMIKAIHRIPSMGVGRPVFYANRTVKQMLDIQAMSKTNIYLTVGEEEGRPKTSLRGIPIRTCDALLENEALVS